MKKFLYSTSRGQSLLELVVALSIISVALVALMTLSATTITGITKGRDLFLGYNYAREAMELVQHYRDTNFLLEDPFDDCISAANVPGKCSNRASIAGNVFIVDAYETDWEIFPAAVSDTCLNDPPLEACQLFITSDGKVLHKRGGLGESPTKFYRMLTVEDITDGEFGPQIGIKVVVEVLWQEEKAKSIFLVKEFYDWRSLE